jgi:hypothetical protein
VSQLLRPIINADHIVLTAKINVDWTKVSPEKRAVFLSAFEELIDISEKGLMEAALPKETTDAKH